jgi:hypothetical protein
VGASNALAAFRLYAAKVPPLSMNALAYMALISLDADAEPWWRQGTDALAVMALGRDELVETGDSKEDARARKAMEHACERVLKPLFAAGAITTTVRSSGHPDRARYAKYRLWLTAPAPDGARDPRHRADQAAPHGIRGAQNSNGGVTGDPRDEVPPHEKHGAPDDGTPRNPYPRPTESVAEPHGFRGAKEYEEQQEERSKTLEEHSLPSSDSAPVRAREIPDGPEKAAPVRVRPLWPSAVPPPESPCCKYPECPTRAALIDGDGYHETCRHLAAVKALAPPTRMRERPEAS